MWMLMTEEGAAHASPIRRGPVSVALVAPVAVGLDRQANGSEFEARVFLHPGRALLGRMSAERLQNQFDLGRASGFETLGAAELAADGRSGFLVEVNSPFVDTGGARHESAVFFVPGLDAKPGA